MNITTLISAWRQCEKQLFELDDYYFNLTLDQMNFNREEVIRLGNIRKRRQRLWMKLYQEKRVHKMFDAGEIKL